MRKPRDIDAELRALEARTAVLKARRIAQLGELVSATGADALEAEVLAGALLAALEAPAQTHSVWKRNGARFFRGDARPTEPGVAGDNDAPAGHAPEA
jgi:Conjugal transfer protein TraD